MALPILCSTGAIVGRVNGRNHRLIMQYYPMLRCDGMEFMMYESWYDRRQEIGDELARSDIPFPVVHVAKSVGDQISRDAGDDTKNAVREFGWNCEMAERIGARQLVLHLWGGMDSDRHIEHNFSVYQTLKRRAQEAGLELTIENVVCSHRDPMTHLRALRDMDRDCAFTIDTKMSAFHGQLPLFALPDWRWMWTEGHIRHLHVNDYGGGYMDWANLRTLFLGQGKIDFDPFFETARAYQFDGSVTCECTAMRPDGSVDVDQLNHSLDLARQGLA